MQTQFFLLSSRKFPAILLKNNIHVIILKNIVTIIIIIINNNNALYSSQDKNQSICKRILKMLGVYFRVFWRYIRLRTEM